ncbi:MAG: Uma2 family endonuclease [Actinomycetota bacterium]|nr:Uma2 family endonuclease [Actinomycetota bacterium]
MALPWGAPLTEDDLATMPEDGHRYELLDGTLLVTPSPNLNHQRCVAGLLVLLHGARRPGFEVLPAPFDVRLSRITVLEPDVLVARRADLTPARLEGPPVLAVEVLSPSTRRIDAGAKRLAYEAAGVPAYWLVDPDVPSLTVLELDAGRYVERATVTGDEAFHAAVPFRVTAVPARLLDD